MLTEYTSMINTCAVCSKFANNNICCYYISFFASLNVTGIYDYIHGYCEIIANSGKIKFHSRNDTLLGEMEFGTVFVVDGKYYKWEKFINVINYFGEEPIIQEMTAKLIISNINIFLREEDEGRGQHIQRLALHGIYVRE